MGRLFPASSTSALSDGNSSASHASQNPAGSSAASASVVTPTVALKPLASGQKMKLIGLAQAPQLNGQLVQLVDYNWEKARWNVRREDGSTVRVLPANLGPLDAPTSATAPEKAAATAPAAVGEDMTATTSGGASSSTLPPKGAADSQAPAATLERLEAWLRSAKEKGTLEKAAKYLRAIARKGGGCVKGFRIEESVVTAAFRIVSGGKELSTLDSIEPVASAEDSIRTHTHSHTHLQGHDHEHDHATSDTIGSERPGSGDTDKRARSEHTLGNSSDGDGVTAGRAKRQRA